MKEIDEDYFKATDSQKPKKIEELLVKDEKILWKGCPKKFSYTINKSIKFSAVAIIWGLIDFCIIYLAATVGNVDPIMWAILIPFFAIHLIPVWIWIGSIFKAAKEINRIKYAITNKRIIEMRGKISYPNISIPLKDLECVNIKRSSIDKMLKVGDIYVTGKEASMVLYDIPNSEFIFEKVNKICVDKILNDTEFFYDKCECVHCGTYYSNTNNRCPACGAPTVKDSMK